MNTFVHIELRAKNDTNGNPRRLSHSDNYTE